MIWESSLYESGLDTKMIDMGSSKKFKKSDGKSRLTRDALLAASVPPFSVRLSDGRVLPKRETFWEALSVGGAKAAGLQFKIFDSKGLLVYESLIVTEQIRRKVAKEIQEDTLFAKKQEQQRMAIAAKSSWPHPFSNPVSGRWESMEIRLGGTKRWAKGTKKWSRSKDKS